MRNWILILCLLLTSAPIWAQVALLGDHDLEAGGFSLLVMVRGANQDGFGSTRYFDSKARLKKIQSEMVYDKLAPVYPFYCQEGFYIVLCKKGEVAEWNLTSPNCHSISGRKGSFEFHGGLNFSESKRARHERIEYSSLEEARRALPKIRQDENLILAIEPPWMAFEGEFDLFLHNASDGREVEESKLRKRIAEDWGDEPFEMEFVSSGVPKSLSPSYSARIKCNKSLYERIDDYKKSELGWQAYPLELDCFWKE